MAFLKINNVEVKGISACVPKNVVDNEEIYNKNWGGYDTFVSTTGIAKHHNVLNDVCASDLCVTAAEQLISDLHWQKQDIDVLIFVSQTPDYYNVPATSTHIQDRLGLSMNCMALDIALGCSGWVYGLSVISSLLQNGTIKKGLLLAGDTPSKFCSDLDKSTYPLFGDAGSVTALEFNENADPMYFALYTDGAKYKAININKGGYRQPLCAESFENHQYCDGIVRRECDLEMDGISVFSFGISKAPKSINELMSHFELDQGKIDLYTFHQANYFMNEKIRKKLKIEESKVPYSLQEYGNTSCASIPLTLVTQCSDNLKNTSLNHIACGFGVGLSWGTVNFRTSSIKIPKLIEI